MFVINYLASHLALSIILVLTLIAFWLRIPILTAVAAVFQLASLMLLGSLAGNLLSILVPFRIQAGSMKPTKMPVRVVVTMVLFQFLFPLAMCCLCLFRRCWNGSGDWQAGRCWFR